MHTKALVHIDSGSAAMEGMLELPHDALGIVLFAHGSGSSRLSPRNNYVARVLREAGIGTLLLDLLTPVEDRAYENRFDIDLLTRRLADAAAWLGRQAATASLPLGLFGASTGAGAALRLAASNSRGTADTQLVGGASADPASAAVAPAAGEPVPAAPVAAIVSRGGRPDLAGEDALALVTAPTLLIVGGNDDAVIGLNRRACAALTCEKALVLVPGATHLFEEPGTLEEVARLASEWFAGHFARSRPG